MVCHQKHTSSLVTYPFRPSAPAHWSDTNSPWPPHCPGIWADVSQLCHHLCLEDGMGRPFRPWNQIHMGSSWSVGGVEDPLKSGEPKVRKPTNLCLSTLSSEWLWLYVNFESSTQKKTQSIGVIIRGGMERKGVWNHNPAIQIRTPMFLDILRFCCTLSNHFCISQFDGFFSQKWRRRDM